ncbi:MAG TPA: AsnC family transcriptional regulator, partial [Gammaproteobacteria bacterium]|nr:AsnC family transcriptional regulator [Gammaproteobacteria bacterium]
MSSKMNLSNIDKKILRELQKDGRITFSELAKR